MDDSILRLLMDVALVFASGILALVGLGLWLRDWALARRASVAPPSGAWLLAFAFFLGWATPFYAWERRRFRTRRRPPPAAFLNLGRNRH